MTVSASQDMEGRFLQSLALLRAVHNPCQRREMAVSTNNGLVNGPVHNLLMQFFTVGSSQLEVFEITSQRLLDQSQAGVYMGKTPHTPPFWPFWAYSRTLPQGVELLV